MAFLTDELRASLPSGGPILSYVEWAHRLTHAPPALHAAAIVPSMSYELIRRGFTIPKYGAPSIWFCAIAPPASAKTMVLRWARDFNKAWYQRLYDDLAPAPWVSLEGSLPGVLQAISDLFDPMTQRTAGILWHTEFSRVLKQEDASEPLRMLYDGDDYDRNLRYLQKQQDRGENVHTKILAPTFAAVVTTTKPDLERVANRAALEGGLFSRFLWLYESLREDELQAEPDWDAEGREQALAVWAHWSAALDGQRVQGLDKEIVFDDAAVKFLRGPLFDRVKPFMTRNTSLESHMAIRVLPHAAKLAAIYAASQIRVHRHRIWVTNDDMVRAANMTLRCFEGACRLGNELMVRYQDYGDRQSLILDAVRESNVRGLSRSEIYHLFHNRIDKAQLDMMIQSLVDANQVVEHSVVGRGRPTIRLFAMAVGRLRSET